MNMHFVFHLRKARLIYSQFNTLAIFVSIMQGSNWEGFVVRSWFPARCIAIAAFSPMICRNGPARIPFREATGEKLVQSRARGGRARSLRQFQGQKKRASEVAGSRQK